MENAVTLVWFRDDLRLSDNPALCEAATTNSPVVALYILDEESEGFRGLGAASKWWLDKSLRKLEAALAKQKIPLIFRRGKAAEIFASLISELRLSHVFWNRRYGEAERICDQQLKSWLSEKKINVKSFNATLLVEPWEVVNGQGTAFKVFTPFWKNVRANYKFRDPLPAPKLNGAKISLTSDQLHDWGLHPTSPDWSTGFSTSFTPGEDGAHKRLYDFLDHEMAGYSENRDRPDLPSTSRLSPHLRFGEISPLQIWHYIKNAQQSGILKASERDVEKFCAEIGWREFSYHLLYQFPQLATKNFQAKFDAFPWLDAEDDFQKWTKGQTGYPIVDAGMRELWQTGFMHNRVRMIVASFLIKHLMIDWRKGEAWFWDCLLDADPASNTASWQWVAGSGADAAPYFRIFNPIMQGEKFDPDGTYVRRFVPELEKMPARYIHKPWEAPQDILKAAHVTLGKTYPAPIVDHGSARDRALQAFQSLSA